MDYYEVLEVSQRASKEVIRQAYRTLVKKYHPDVQPGAMKKQAEEHTAILNKAYETLSDDYKRKIYDETLINHDKSEYEEKKEEVRNEDSKQKSEPKSIQLFSGLRRWIIVASLCLVVLIIIGKVNNQQFIDSPNSNDSNISSIKASATSSSTVKAEVKPVVSESTNSSIVELPTSVKTDIEPKATPIKTEVKSISSEPTTSPKIDLPTNSKTEVEPKATIVLKLENYFSLGSNKEEVKSIMGTPSGINDYSVFVVWNYGLSNVKFDTSGKVIGWSGGSNLKVSVGNKIQGSSPFTIGSSLSEVIAAMGTPSGINDYSVFVVWNYGLSNVKFDTSGKVIGWSGSNLKVSMGNKVQDSNPFTIGSSRTEVVAAMGTPSGINDYSVFVVWNYGLSTVKFDTSGKVISWSGNDLKVN